MTVSLFGKKVLSKNVSYLIFIPFRHILYSYYIFIYFFPGWSGCTDHKLIWDCNEDSTKLPLRFPQKVRKSTDIIPATHLNPFILGEKWTLSHLYLNNVLLESVKYVFLSTHRGFKLSIYSLSGNTWFTLIWCFLRMLNFAILGQTAPASLNYHCCSFTTQFFVLVIKLIILYLFFYFYLIFFIDSVWHLFIFKNVIMYLSGTILNNITAVSSSRCSDNSYIIEFFIKK